MQKSGNSLGAIGRELGEPRSSVQRYQKCGTAKTLRRSSRKSKLTPTNERALVQKICFNPMMTKKQVCQELKASGINVSLSTVQRPLLQERHLKARLECAKKHKDKDKGFWKCMLQIKRIITIIIILLYEN
uniref:Transposase Tc1-like domain-containing protein n=1 Tax=Paramormyrops kingsleyae TaxID=1676925 RepID=A0A3B3R1Q8_9TELE